MYMLQAFPNGGTVSCPTATNPSGIGGYLFGSVIVDWGA